METFLQPVFLTRGNNCKVTKQMYFVKQLNY